MIIPFAPPTAPPIIFAETEHFVHGVKKMFSQREYFSGIPAGLFSGSLKYRYKCFSQPDQP
jgi:hypothetical protein